MNISAIIVAKGNPPHIFEAIDSIKDFASEIIVVDIGLDQQLKNRLIENSIIRIIEISEKITYVELIREKTKKFATNDWLIFLDPDEILSEKSKEIIKKKIKNYDYFSIPRKNIIFGKWIEYSRWWPDYQIRVFKKNSVIWPTEIHQQPKTSEKGLTIEAKEENAIIHHNYQSIDEYLSKAMRYAKAEAKTKNKQQENFSLSKAVSQAISEFISRYFAHEGYKDGTHGLVLAFFQMFYPLMVYFYLWEIKKYESESQEETIKQSSSFFLRGSFETNFWLNKKGLIKNQNLMRRIINFLLKKTI